MKPCNTLRSIAGATVILYCATLSATAQLGDFDIDITRKGYRIAHFGQIDTDLQFSEFFTADHTITAWVMPEFTYNYWTAIVGVNGSGTLTIGQGDYREGNGGFGKAGHPVLWVKFGGSQALYLASDYQRRKWNHLAIVQRRMHGVGTIALYLNGRRLTAFKRTKIGDDANDDPLYWFSAAPDASSTSVPTGTLRLGRTNVTTNRQQFYGLLDDVAVYNKAMSDFEVQTLMGSGISGSHPNLVAGYSFDKYSAFAPHVLSAKLKRPVTPNGRAFHVDIPHPRTDANSALFDNVFLVSPSTIARRLPFKPGQVWKVIQEFDAKDGSHNSDAAFCWDFVRADGTTANQTIIAAAPGTIIRAFGPKASDLWDGPNFRIHMVVVPDKERDAYLHFAPGSFTEVFLNGKTPLFYPQPGMPLTWRTASQDQPLAKIWPDYPTGAHSHYCAGDVYTVQEFQDGVVIPSIPTSFHRYQVSTDQGVTWQPVAIGMPRKGQWIRRTD
jgi:hypothetical protein